MKVDHAKLASKVTVIESETKKNSSDIKVLNENLEESNKNVKELFRLSREFRQEMDELSEKVAELHLLKKQIGVSLDADADAAVHFPVARQVPTKLHDYRLLM